MTEQQKSISGGADPAALIARLEALQRVLTNGIDALYAIPGLAEVHVTETTRQTIREALRDAAAVLRGISQTVSRLTAEQARLEAWGAESSAKHRSISEKAGLLRDALVDLSDDDTFAEPVTRAAKDALGAYDSIAYGDGEYTKRYRNELKELRAALAAVRALLEQWRTKAIQKHYTAAGNAAFNACADQLAALLPREDERA